MAAWGRYGGRLRVKASMNGEDSPEILRMLIAKGANPNIKDEKGKCPLDTACSSGGDRCIKMLVEAGGDVNNSDADGVTPLHECFYRGNQLCLKELMAFKPSTSPKTRTGRIPMDCVFIDNMHGMLDYVLNDKEFTTISQGDPNLTVTSENIEKLLSQAIMYKAQECYDILLKYQSDHKM
jgi:ankyrin repeat protein